MKIAIVGGSPSSQYLAPYDDPEWEIWVHGNQMDRHENRRVTRIFEIHDDLSEHEPGYAGWLASKDISLVTGRNFPEEVITEYTMEFPFAAASALMEGDHLTSTPAYMMAQAILDIKHNGHLEDHIAIYGVDMAVDDNEYFYQRPTMYAWIGYARGLGIKVTIADESPLFVDNHVEGAGSGGKPDFAAAPFTSKNLQDVVDIHQQKIDVYTGQIGQLQKLVDTHDGCRQAYARLVQIARAVESGQSIRNLTDSLVIKE